MWSIACCESVTIRRMRLGVAGRCWMDSTRRWRRFASAVVLARKGRGILLRVLVQRFFTVLCMADITFRGSNDTRYFVQLVLQVLSEHVGPGRVFSHRKAWPRFRWHRLATDLASHRANRHRHEEKGFYIMKGELKYTVIINKGYADLSQPDQGSLIARSEVPTDVGNVA